MTAPVDAKLLTLREIELQAANLKKHDDLRDKELGFGIAEALDWFELRDKEFSNSWLCEPLIPEGAYLSLVGSAGSGKSLLMQEIAAAIATGNGILRQPPGLGRPVLYIDLENPESEIQDRIFRTFGYTAAELDQRLFYLSMPSCPTFDAEKAQVWWNMHLEIFNPVAVFIDTMSRVISGRENDSDTYINFYRHSAMVLKRKGIALVTLDHLGKNPELDARGSSAKADGPDFMLKLTKTEKPDPDAPVQIKIKVTKRRNEAVPNEILITRMNGRHSMDAETFTPSESKVARDMDTLKLPLGVTSREAVLALNKAGKGVRTSTIIKALRVRKLPNYTPKLPGSTF